MSTVTGSQQSSLRDIRKANQTATRLGQRLITGKAINAPQDGPSTWLQAGRAQSTAGYLDVLHTGLNELATDIRAADTTMQAIERLLGAMQGQLEQSQKYAVGDPIRQQLITGANATRKQIDALVGTTSPPGARNLLSDPATNSQAGDIRALVGLHGEQKVVHAQQVDTGSGGLNIADLPLKATDLQIQTQLQAMESAQSTLQARRNGLATDASDITRFIDQSSSVSSFYLSEAETLTAADAAEAAVELQSVSTQQSLALQSLASINTSRDAILELLR